MIQKLAPHTTERSCQKLLCFYVNATNHLQIIRLTHSTTFTCERVIFPGQRFLFEAEPEAVLEVIMADSPTAMLADKINCSSLEVEQGLNRLMPLSPSSTAA